MSEEIKETGYERLKRVLSELDDVPVLVELVDTNRELPSVEDAINSVVEQIRKIDFAALDIYAKAQDKVSSSVHWRLRTVFTNPEYGDKLLEAIEAQRQAKIARRLLAIMRILGLDKPK